MALHALRYEDPVDAERLNGQGVALGVLIKRIHGDSVEVIRLCQEFKVPDCRLSALNKLYNVTTAIETPVPNPTRARPESDNKESDTNERPMSIPRLSVAQLKTNAKRARDETRHDVDESTPADGKTKRAKIETTPTVPSDYGLDGEGRASRRSWAVSYVGRRGSKKIRDLCERAHNWLVSQNQDNQCRLCYWRDTENESIRTPCCGRCLCTDCVVYLAKVYSKYKKNNRKGAYAMSCPSCREPFSAQNYDIKKPYLPAPRTVDDRVLECLVHYWSGVTEGRSIRGDIAEWRVSVADYGILPEMDMIRFKRAAAVDNAYSGPIMSESAPSAYALITSDISDADEQDEDIRASDQCVGSVGANVTDDTPTNMGQLNSSSTRTDHSTAVGQLRLDRIGRFGLSAIDQLNVVETLQRLHELSDI